ncbi:flagellar assembly protein FliH [Cohnella sp. CFH 77786]|uniref:FliH/SctL family protein n=1 Tax=Cohnella sp. CFH 77786 TaxID=2662265 RepID=UPI001C608DB7|nr:FliH/SctL family protein [Cohnella sp. CFH 77786]MBW5444576.1 flagellar assembly protein FliH [Cohnella sp. CFH 77786]
MSNLIKSGRVVSLDDLKQLELIRRFVPNPQKPSGSDGEAEGKGEADVETLSMKERILEDAERTAQEIVRQAREEAEDIRAAARMEAESWWQSRRAEDAGVTEEARQSGYAEGYAAGAERAESELRAEWESRMREARSLVEQAYISKERIIAEAEAFVVELSCSIAEKLLSAKLAEEPERAIRLFAGALARRKEQGVITLCVAPAQFEFVSAAKDELSLVLDAQAELQIVPDASVGDGGCIVRSSFGSIDARIDTQLSTVRAELLRVAAHAAEEGNADAAS